MSAPETTTALSDATPSRRTGRSSLPKRLVFATVLAIVAAGLSFYVVLFAGLIVTLASGQLNVPNAPPALNTSLRTIGVPFSFLIAGVVFATTLWRTRPR